MPFASDRIMFEIYRETSFSRRYRVVYFTELDEHNKEAEINAAMGGEHVYDGFIRQLDATTAKARIADVLRRLNAGETIDAGELDILLSPYAPA